MPDEALTLLTLFDAIWRISQLRGYEQLTKLTNSQIRPHI